MKYKRLLIILFLLSPLSVYAHGEQALIPLGIDLLNFALFGLVMTTKRFTTIGKVVMISSFVIAVYAITFWFYKSVAYLDYLGGMIVPNLIMLSVPWIVYLVVYFLFRKRFKKVD